MKCCDSEIGLVGNSEERVCAHVAQRMEARNASPHLAGFSGQD